MSPEPAHFATEGRGGRAKANAAAPHCALQHLHYAGQPGICKGFPRLAVGVATRPGASLHIPSHSTDSAT